MARPLRDESELLRAHQLIASLRARAEAAERAARAASAALVLFHRSGGTLPCAADCGCPTSNSGEVQCRQANDRSGAHGSQAQ